MLEEDGSAADLPKRRVESVILVVVEEEEVEVAGVMNGRWARRRLSLHLEPSVHLLRVYSPPAAAFPFPFASHDPLQRYHRCRCRSHRIHSEERRYE